MKKSWPIDFANCGTCNALLSIFDNSLTEVANMKANGYKRFWDCGHYRFVYIPDKHKKPR